MKNWKHFTFENAPLKIIDGDRGVNYPKQADFMLIGHCLFLNAGNVTAEGFDFSNCSFISENIDNKLHKGKLTRQDIVLTTRGTVGNVAFYDDRVPFDHIRINSGMVIFRVDQEEIFPNYLYFFLKSNIFKEQVKAYSTGSAQPQLPIKDIKRLEILLPPLAEQRAIASVLGGLNDKIELNRRINRTFDSIAQAIFKSWFVSNAVAKWDYVDLGSVTTEIRTKVKNQRLPVMSAVKTGNLVLSDGFFTKQVYSDDISKYIVVEHNDFAYNPARVNIGSLGVNSFNYAGCVSPVYVVFRAEREYHHFLSFFFKSPNFREEVSVRASGSVRQSLSYGDFARIKVNYPSLDLVRQFNYQYEGFLKAINQLEAENVKIAEIRETLLPRLLSGELSVCDLGPE